MAERLNGTLRIKNQGFGFISRAGGRDLFVLGKEIAKAKAKDGDQVECDEVQDPKKDPGTMMGVNLRVLQASPEPSKKTAPAAPISGLTVKIEGGEINGGILPVTITVKRGNKPAEDVEVKLIANGKAVKLPKAKLTPNDLGECVFLVSLVEVGKSVDADQCALLAEVSGRHYSALWSKKEKEQKKKDSEPSPPPPKLVVPIVEKLRDNNNGGYLFSIQAAPNSLVVASSTLQIAYRKHQLEVSELVNVPIPTEADGSLVVELVVAEPGVYGNVYFHPANGFSLRSSPQFVSRPQTSAPKPDALTRS